MKLTVVAQRTSIYEREVDVLPTDENELLGLVLDTAGGDEVDGTTDRIDAYVGEEQVL